MSVSFVCISYALDDAPEAAQIASAVREAGWDVCFQHVVEPAHEADERNSRLLSEAGCAVVVWSSNASGSTILRTDVLKADRAAKLVLVLLDDAAPPMPIATIASVVDWRGHGAPANDQILVDRVMQYAGMPRARAGRIVSNPGPQQQRTLFLAIGGVAILTGFVLIGGSLFIGREPESALPTLEGRQWAEGRSRMAPLPELRRSSGSAKPGSDGDLADRDSQLSETVAIQDVGSPKRQMGWEEAAWQSMLSRDDLLLQLDDLVNFRIDFPTGHHALLATKMEADKRDVLLKVRMDLTHLGYLSSSAASDNETLLRAVASFERSVGLLPTGRLSEGSISALSTAAELSAIKEAKTKSPKLSPKQR